MSDTIPSPTPKLVEEQAEALMQRLEGFLTALGAVDVDSDALSQWVRRRRREQVREQETAAPRPVG